MWALFLALLGLVGVAHAQEGQAVPQEDQITIFTGFAVAVAAVFIYLARDMILRKKTEYDGQELDSKHDREYEKYHSDWGDDFEDVGGRTRDGLGGRADWQSLPDMYETIGVPRNATQEQIKTRYRALAKASHPDRSPEKDAGKMAEINLAYETLSDPKLREEYDRYLAG